MQNLSFPKILTLNFWPYNCHAVPLKLKNLYIANDMSILLLQHCEEWEAAKICYEDSLSINPNHVPSLQALGLTHLQLGSPR